MESPKIYVNFFQRRPRKGFSFSIEYIFEDIRRRLIDKISPNVYISKCYNDGYCTKVINIIEAAFRKKADVNHITGEIHFLNLLMKKKNVILTVHDCGVMHRKRGLSKKIVRCLYFSTPINRSKYVTAVSERTKQEIIGFTDCDPDKIHVIPVAIDPIYVPFPKAFNKEKPHILQIGTGFNKNLLKLIEAIEGISCRLTIIGKLSNKDLRALEKYNIEYENEYNISNRRLLEKYRECDIVAFVSTFEGFGMPIVEGNAVERAVVTSNVSSMPEVAANAACLVDPHDTESIKAGILKVILDEAYREELINNGKVNKLRFDADTVANMYYKLYHKVLHANK